MSRDKNFLLGHGERLTGKVTVPRGGGSKNAPYDFSSAKKRIAQDLLETNKEIDSTPDEACPKNEVVALLTMHPRYISKSEFPDDLLRSVGLRSVGSRSASVKPEKWGTKKHPDGEVTTEQVFVAGTKKAYHDWSSNIQDWTGNQKSSFEITKLEKVSPYAAKEKIKSIAVDRDETTFEVVLHNAGDESIIEAFEAFVKKKAGRVFLDRRRDIGGLTFIPVKAPTQNALDIAQFSFLRVLRGMPTLRPVSPKITRSGDIKTLGLPTGQAISSDVRAVIFDGGIPNVNYLNEWVTAIDPPGIGKAKPGYLEHGLAVTSAFLFGHITGNNLPRPFCNVDHVRVLDEHTGKDANDFEILDVLDRILGHLNNNPNKYQFANLSLGPDLPITDDEVTLWTASLDEYLSTADLLTTVAVGNNGHLDAISGLNRVQVPSDAVNALAVGASNCLHEKEWDRAEYSCIGPGRRPGVVKPDGLAFGGSEDEMFMVLAASSTPSLSETSGTSFASPLTLRSSAGISSHIGGELSPRSIRALMIHRAACQNKSRRDVGWGKFETDVGKLITCDDNEALVVYQGELPIGEHLRAFVPIPKDLQLTGDVDITATLVIAPEVDPEHPGAYTRAGLEVCFRPHSEKFSKPINGKKPKHQKSATFFSTKNMYGQAEYMFREDGCKWEPCLKNKQTFRSSSLQEACFDIYYWSTPIIESMV